jgi:anti-sigma factor RsiW
MSNHDDENRAGGLWCSEVLVGLQAFLDDELDASTRAAVVVHVQACDRCARFGATFAAATAQIRTQFAGSLDENSDSTSDSVMAALLEQIDEPA